METKQCRKCGIIKSREEFTSNKKLKDGMGSYCKKCASKNVGISIKKNPEKRRENNKKWKAKNPEKVKEYSKKYISENKERIYANNKKWLENNKEKYIITRTKYNLKNREKNTKRVMKSHFARLQATPKWVDLNEINALYKEASEKGLTVDHIAPIQGDNMCGLNVTWNIQFLTKSENSIKGHKVCPVLIKWAKSHK